MEYGHTTAKERGRKNNKTDKMQKAKEAPGFLNGISPSFMNSRVKRYKCDSHTPSPHQSRKIC